MTQKKHKRNKTEEGLFVFLTGYGPVSLRKTISPAAHAELIPRTIVPSTALQSVAGKHTFMEFLFFLEQYQTQLS